MPPKTPPKKISRRALIKRGASLLCATVVPTGLVTTHWLSVERTELRLPKWSGAPFKVAFLSDLHLDTDADVELTQRAIEEALAFRSNVMIFGGDYLTENPPDKLKLLSQALKAVPGAACPVLGILGNWDYWQGRSAQTAEVLDQLGVRLLCNEEVTVGGVRIIGLDDGLYGKAAYEQFETQEGAGRTILLLHEPDMVRFAPRWVSLQLSGHSHGGQICLPGGIPLMGTTEGEKYVRGFFPDAEVPLYVTRGIGTRRVPFRYWCRPEVSLLTLSS